MDALFVPRDATNIAALAHCDAVRRGTVCDHARQAARRRGGLFYRIGWKKMNTLTTVKTFADVRQVLRGYGAAHPP
jgi:hypothetical protein